MDVSTDNELMAEVKNGDLEKLAGLYEKYNRPLFAFFYKMTSDADLTVRMKTDRGSVFSDFEIALEPRKSLVEPADKAGGRRITLEEWTSGKIGRGGNDVLLKSYEGNIYIRKINKAGRP